MNTEEIWNGNNWTTYTLGQTKSVEIVRFIIKDTIEEEIYKENKIEDLQQKTQLCISEVTDDTINLCDDKLHSLSEAIKQAKLNKEENKKEKEKRKQNTEINEIDKN